MTLKQQAFGVSLRTKVLAAILLAVLPLGLAIASFTVYAGQDERADERLSRERKFRIALAAILNVATDAETGVRGFLLTKRRPFLEPYERARSILPQRVRDLEDNASQDERDEVLLIEQLLEEQFAALDILLDESFPNTQFRFSREKAVTDRFRELIARMIETTEADIFSTLEERAAARSRSHRTLVVGGTIGGLGSIATGILLVGNFVRRVKNNTENARRLAEGGELLPAEEGADELAELSRRLHETALLLRARESVLRQTREEADRANQAKSEFLSRMSHELRTPLNAVIGFAQLLRDEVAPEAREDVREILRAGKHLLALIDEVLDLSRIEAGMIRMSVEPVSVWDVLNESIVLVRAAAAQRSIGVVVADFDHDLHVRADRQRFKQVLLNLLSNSIKYNRDYGSVHVGVARNDVGDVRIAVTDEGNGIPHRVQRDLFAPFSRLGAERTSIEGTGLGLALSKHLMEAMGGEIGFDSEPGVGSTFWITLSHTTETEAPVREATKAPAAVARSQFGIPITVLQFEDNPSNVRLIARAVRSRPDVALVTAMTGAEGFEILRDRRADLIFLDVNLPDMSGTDVLIRLRANPETREVPVVVVSADATEAQIEHMLALGAERYLTKPIDIEELNDVLDSVAARAEREVSSDG